MSLDNVYYNIDIPEDANLIRFMEVPEKGTSDPVENGTSITGMYNIDIPEDAKLITYRVLPEEVSEAYDTEEGEDLAIDIPEDSNQIPLAACSVRRDPRKHAEEKTSCEDEAASVAALIQHLQQLSEENAGSRRMSEDYLFRKLMDNFKFGTFGGAIYVRSDEVYRLVTQDSLSTLLLSVMNQQEKSRFRMQSMPGVFARLTHDPEVAGNALVIPEGRALFLNGAWDVVKRKHVEAKENELYPFRVQANYDPGLGKRESISEGF